MPNNELITSEHGKMLAQWCLSPGNSKTTNGKGELLSELRSLTVSIHGWAPPMKAGDWAGLKPKLEQWMWDEAIISDTESLAELDASRLGEVIKLAKTKLQPA